MQLSHKLFAFACLFVILLAAFPTFSSAEVSAEGGAASTPVEVSEEQDATSEYEEEVEEVEVEQQMYVMPAADVQTYIKFLGVEDNKFVAGNEVTALIGMTNAGDKTYNVSYVGAHLHSPYDYNFYVQNFTVRWTSNLLPPHSEVTVEYKFRPDEKLEPLDFQLSGWVIYNDSAPTPIIYRNVFFNQTIEVLERRQEWTVQSVFTYGLTIAGLAIAGYVASQQLGGRKRRSNVTSSSAASTEAASAGWDTKIYKPSTISKAVGPKKHIKPTSNKQ